MSVPGRRLLSFALLNLALLPVFLSSAAHAEDTAALSARLHAADLDSALDAPGLKPWHLKLDVQLFDAKGQNPQDGTIEAWWLSPASLQVVYTTPTYTATELHTAAGVLRSKGAASPPAVLDVLLQQVIHPMPSAAELDGTVPDLHQQTKPIPLDCIMLDQPIKGVAHPPLGLFPTYCFDPGKDFLRITYNYGSQLVIRNQVGVFQGRHVATKIGVKEKEVLTATAHVSSLESKAELTPPPIDQSSLESPAKMARVSSGVMNGLALTQAAPRYPESAKQNHIAGSVVMRALIGRDGHVRTLKVVSSKDPDLAIAALAAVRTWTYQLYLLNGTPTEVETTVTVNFNFGP